MSEYCVCCGSEIPEGRQVCNICKRKAWRKKSLIAEAELIAAEENAQTQLDKDIIHLKQIALSIKPYSRWWRWGYLGSLKRAIKALENEAKSNSISIKSVSRVLLDNNEDTYCEMCGRTIECDENGDMPNQCPYCKRVLSYKIFGK